MVGETRRLLIISDIHSNILGLEAVLKDAEQYGPYTDKLCAGDIIGYNANPAECIEKIISENFTAVAGNHDRVGRGDKVSDFNWLAEYAIEKTQKELKSKHINYLQSLEKIYVDPTMKFLLTHGSFGKGREDCYIFHEQDAFGVMQRRLDFNNDTSEGVIIRIPLGIVGHTHIPLYASGLFQKIKVAY
ncbi:metallophosphoesterase [Candidatus Woesearchaeota archaeon]|nr:metallophosphoesterase [Candidatus Woesearchaeota archaeon]